jgi:hypothetical protein
MSRPERQHVPFKRIVASNPEDTINGITSWIIGEHGHSALAERAAPACFSEAGPSNSERHGAYTTLRGAASLWQ